MRGNSVEEETDRQILAEATENLQALLPEGWEVEFSLARGIAGPDDQGFDATVVIRAPDRSMARFLTEVKAGPMVGAERTVSTLRRLRADRQDNVLLVGPYIGPALRERCAEAGINYLDLTGWCWIQAPSPPMVLRSVGATKDPQPPRASVISRISGASSSRVVRALLNAHLPVGVRMLSQIALVSAGTVSKVLKELESETAITRDDGGAVIAVQKRHLIERWTRDYSFAKANKVRWFLAPRGIQYVLERASQKDVWAVGTGSVAARRLLPEAQVAVTPLSQVALYVPRIEAAAKMLGLVPADRAAANVLLAEPYDAQLLEGEARGAKGLPTTEAGQALADLLTMPGRAPQEAEQLMDFLAATDESWR